MQNQSLDSVSQESIFYCHNWTIIVIQLKRTTLCKPTDESVSEYMLELLAYGEHSANLDLRTGAILAQLRCRLDEFVQRLELMGY